MDFPKPVDEGRCTRSTSRSKIKKRETNNLMQRPRLPSKVVVCSDDKCGWKKRYYDLEEELRGEY